MPAYFTAKFSGRCRYEKCPYSGTISPGQKMTWNRRVKGETYHYECYGALNPLEIPPDEVPPGIGEGFPPVEAEYHAGSEPLEKLGGAGKGQGEGEGQGDDQQDVLESMATALAPRIDKKLKLTEKIDKAFKAQLPEQKIIDLVKEHSIKETHLTVMVDNETRKIEGLVHKSVPDIIEILLVHKNAYIYGGAGVGKTFMAMQISELIGLDFEVFQLGKLSPESALKGFIDGNGEKQEQRFIKAIQRPCLIFFDEFDRWPSHITTLLNSFLANGYIDARGYDKRIDRHEKCYVLAAGNTSMRGRDEYFPEAVAQEFSTMDRPFYYHVEYDNDLERAITLGINPNAEEWLKWVQKMRPEALSGKHGKIFATPRASYEGARSLANTSLSLTKIADGTVFKGVDKATKDKLTSLFPVPNVKRLEKKKEPKIITQKELVDALEVSVDLSAAEMNVVGELNGPSS